MNHHKLDRMHTNPEISLPSNMKLITFVLLCATVVAEVIEDVAFSTPEDNVFWDRFLQRGDSLSSAPTSPAPPKPTTPPVMLPIAPPAAPPRPPPVTPPIPSPVAAPFPSPVKPPVTPQQTENMAAAFLKCYSLLDATAINGTMTQSEYLVFLMLMSDGMINFSEFEDLPDIYMMIFYTAACSNSDCSPGNLPQIEIGTIENPNATIQFLCQQTLTSTTSTAETIIEYTIRYSTSAIEEADLATCLSTAIVNVLLKELASCPQLTEVDINSTRRMTRRRESEHRHLQMFGSVMTDENSMCAYSIESSVESLTELPCDSSIPGSTEGIDNERCALIRSNAIVTAPQLYEPFSTLLRSQMITILRTVIDNGSLTTFFPPSTCRLS